MSRLTPAFLALALSSLAAVVTGCASSNDDTANAADNLVSAAPLSVRVDGVAAQIEQRSGGHTYVAKETFSDADLPHGVPNALSGGARAAALADCVVYGGGAGGNDEDINKYLDASARSELAAKLDTAIGDASAVYRINSFGIGDQGDDFSAHCTVAVRAGENQLLMLQGHGRDALL